MQSCFLAIIIYVALCLIFPSLGYSDAPDSPDAGSSELQGISFTDETISPKQIDEKFVVLGNAETFQYGIKRYLSFVGKKDASFTKLQKLFLKNGIRVRQTRIFQNVDQLTRSLGRGGSNKSVFLIKVADLNAVLKRLKNNFGHLEGDDSVKLAVTSIKDFIEGRTFKHSILLEDTPLARKEPDYPDIEGPISNFIESVEEGEVSLDRLGIRAKRGVLISTHGGEYDVLKVSSIRIGSAAFRAGLQPGDVFDKFWIVNKKQWYGAIGFDATEQDFSKFESSKLKDAKIEFSTRQIYRKYDESADKFANIFAQSNIFELSELDASFTNNDQKWVSTGGSDGLHERDSDGKSIPREPLAGQIDRRIGYVSPDTPEEIKRRELERQRELLEREERRRIEAAEAERWKGVILADEECAVEFLTYLKFRLHKNARCKATVEKMVREKEDAERIVAGRLSGNLQPDDEGKAEFELKRNLLNSILNSGPSASAIAGSISNSIKIYEERRHDRYLEYAEQGKVCFAPKTAQLCVQTRQHQGTYRLYGGILQSRSTIVNSCSGRCANASGWCDNATGRQYSSIVAFERAHCRAGKPEELKAIRNRRY